MSVFVFILVISSAIFHASWNFILRKVSGNVIVVWLALFVGSFSILPLAIAKIYFSSFSETFSTTGVICILASGLVHGIYFSLIAQTYKQGEISVVYPVMRGAGIALTSLLAYFILNENISMMGAGGISLIIAGILFIGGKSILDRKNWDTLKLALSVGTMIGACTLIDKVGVTNMDPVVYITLFFTAAGLIMTPYIIRNYWGSILPTIKKYPGYIMTIGQGSIATYLMILIAFTMGSVSYIVPVREFAVIISVFLGIVFLNEKITFYKFVGIAAISFGLICLRLG